MVVPSTLAKPLCEGSPAIGGKHAQSHLIPRFYDYYFSRSNADWISAYGDDPIPVQIVVSGANWSVSLHRYDYHNFTHIYSFNGGSDSVPDDVFKIPIGTICKGRGPGKSYPALPDYFSTYIELADNTDQTIRVFKVPANVHIIMWMFAVLYPICSFVCVCVCVCVCV